MSSKGEGGRGERLKNRSGGRRGCGWRRKIGIVEKSEEMEGEGVGDS